MAHIFGQPTSYKSYSTRVSTMKSCMDYCFYQPTCVAVYVEMGSKYCWVFDIGQIQKFRMTSSASGHRFAAKIENPANTCASSFQGNSMVGSVTTLTSYLTYKIQPSGDNIWAFTTTLVLNCPDNYQLFTRPKGLWCIGVVTVNKCISQVDSVSKCSASGAVLTGLQTMEETNYIYDVGKNLLAKETFYNRYGIWINGQRKTSCMPPNKRSAACNGINEFVITDPLLNAYAGYKFASNEPNGIIVQSSGINCLNILIAKTRLQGVDDNLCTIPSEEPELCYKGYACGIKPIKQT
ncbi:unnamed protein product [Caenorhabditis brenneri]